VTSNTNKSVSHVESSIWLRYTRDISKRKGLPMQFRLKVSRTIKGPLQSGRGRNIMARRTDTTDVDVDTEVEDVPTETTADNAEKAPKAKKEPARGDLPEGYVTPVGLAKILSERKLHTNREGETVDVKPQMVYSYIKNAAKDDPFPMETVTDSIGKERQAVKVDDGVAWWIRKNERTAQRKQNAAQKAAAKAEKAAKAEAAPAEEPAAEVVEAE
jgi:hypothetical protein